MKKYSTPDKMMSEEKWKLFYETIKTYVSYTEKAISLWEMGMENDEFFEDLFEYFVNVVVIAMDGKPIKIMNEGEEVDGYAFDEEQWDKVSVNDALYDIVSDYAHLHMAYEYDLEEIAYLCACYMYFLLCDQQPKHEFTCRRDVTNFITALNA